MLEVNGLTKHYGKLVAVSGVSFRADRGETIGLLGPNGAGKTTTVSIISGLLNADSGEVLIEGKQVQSDTDPVKLKIGLVPQDMALYEQLTAHDNLIFFAALYSLAGAKAKTAIDDALHLVGSCGSRGRQGENLQRRHEAAAESRGSLAARSPDSLAG
jgi:ABC-2 type transport system ATP-binding protein